MNNFKFSVLMSVYHKERPEHLRQSLDSVFSQTFKSDNIVLVEDGILTHELESIVQDYEHTHPELHVVRFEKNRGLGYALNDGIKHCRHEIIARMDADDIAKPERFEKQMRVMKEHPEYGMISSWIDEFIETPGDTSSIRKVPETPEENLRYAKSRCPVNHPTVVFRKKEVEAVGGYQTEYFPEDYFLWIKMLMNKCNIFNLQESLLWFRYSPETFKRRGGWKYATDEVKTQINIYRLGFINVPTLAKNICIRFTTRILPNRIRGFIYTRLLRR